jgi:hypothetical protein
MTCLSSGSARDLPSLVKDFISSRFVNCGLQLNEVPFAETGGCFLWGDCEVHGYSVWSGHWEQACL